MARQQMTHFEYEDRILDSLRRRDGDVTAGDVAADTGLPYDETEIALRRMLSVYKSHLDVDDDGNLRYRFDPALTRRGEEPGRLWHDIKTWSWKAFKLIFKVWIMVTLVGYTVIFLLLLLALAVAGIAASASSDNDSGSDLIMLPLYLFACTLEFLFWISIFSSDGGMGRRGMGRRRGFGRMQRKKPKPDKAFYQKVFDYVLGPEVKRDPLAGQRAFASFVRARGGRVTAAEWASRTGQSLDEAENALTASLVRFSGDVDVNEDGVLVYRFDELRVTADEGGAPGRDLPPVWTKQASAPSFTGNQKSTNVWVSILNGFNLLMASGVLWVSSQAVAATGAALSAGVTIGLGIVPLVFSLIFFAVPLLRKLAHRRKVREAAKENERREDLQRVFASVRGGQAAPVELSERADAKLVADFDGDVQVLDDGRIVYLFDTLAEQMRAGEEARKAADTQVIFGKTVFSSDDEEVSMAQAELDDFDARLSRELEGSHVEFESAAPVSVGSR